MEGSGRIYRFAFRVMSDISATLMVPAIVGALAGQWLDDRFSTGHSFFIGLLAFAFIGTAVVLYRKIREYGKEYQELLGSNGPSRS